MFSFSAWPPSPTEAAGSNVNKMDETRAGLPSTWGQPAENPPGRLGLALVALRHRRWAVFRVVGSRPT